LDDLAYILEVSEVMIGTELRVIILGSSCMHLLSRSVFMASCFSEEGIHTRKKKKKKKKEFTMDREKQFNKFGAF